MASTGPIHRGRESVAPIPEGHSGATILFLVLGFAATPITVQGLLLSLHSETQSSLVGSVSYVECQRSNPGYLRVNFYFFSIYKCVVISELLLVWSWFC